MTKALQPRGTRAGYLTHLRQSTEPCDDCRRANREHRRAHFSGNRKRNRDYQRAWRRASVRLQHAYPSLWAALLEEELEQVATNQDSRRGAATKAGVA